MTKSDEDAPAAAEPAGGPLLYILAAAFAAMAGYGAVVISDFIARERPPENAAMQNSGGNPPAESAQDPNGGMAKLVRVRPPKPIPAIAFQDDAGHQRSLADWKGKVALINLWATWCAPCKVEMPSLSRLQAQLGGDDFAVVTISLDRDSVELPRKFLAANNLGNLPLLIDPTGGLAGKLGAIGLPATLIIDREGREIARLLGPAEWDSRAAQDVIRAAIAGR